MSNLRTLIENRYPKGTCVAGYMDSECNAILANSFALTDTS